MLADQPAHPRHGAAGTAVDRLVSVVIPTFNQSRFIRRTVESALAQTYPAVEVVVVDDGSSEDTAGALSALEARITLITQRNTGVAIARNQGLARARGRYVCFLDGDDILLPTKIERDVALLTAHPDVDVAYCGWRYIDTDDGPHPAGAYHPHRRGDLLRELLTREFYCLPSAATIRTAVVEGVGGFDRNLPGVADTDLWVRLAAAGSRFDFVDETLMLYRQQPGSMSSNLPRQLSQELARVEKYFASPTVAPATLALRGLALAAIHFEFAAKFVIGGDAATARQLLEQALALCPDKAEDERWLLGWLSASAMQPEIVDPQRFLAALVAALPLGPAALRRLERRAAAAYHVSTVFAAHAAHDPRRARRHLVPAIAGRPGILGNRGFLKIAAEVITSSD